MCKKPTQSGSLDQRMAIAKKAFILFLKTFVPVENLHLTPYALINCYLNNNKF